VVFTLAFSSQLRAEPSDWLMRINKAAAELSFSGTFVYYQNGQLEAMEVVRRIRDGMMQERLYSLNGEAREIVRDMNRVWCYIPDQNVGVHDFRQTSESGFPRILPTDLESLEKNYHFAEGDSGRVAGRHARQINVIPNDGFRYGYSLWADEETGLLLRSDLLEDSGEIVEQYQFVVIRVGHDISDQELAATTSKDDLVWYGNTRPEVSDAASKSRWQFNQVPAGYVLSRHIRRMSPMDSEEVEHLVFTDGLSTVSVFIKPARDGQSGMVGLSRMGAVHAYRDTIDGFRVTVMGEVPAKTVEYLARGVSYTP
jgi:sigma-E factor negative regulatory protein RseB